MTLVANPRIALALSGGGIRAMVFHLGVLKLLAERGLFDYIFLAEGLRVREHGGRIHDLDVAGRPATLAVLTAIASITQHIGVVGTLSSTFNEPVELARQLASLDHLSGGRAGWNVVTSPDAFHGGNFRRGGFLPFFNFFIYGFQNYQGVVYQKADAQGNRNK